MNKTRWRVLGGVLCCAAAILLVQASAEAGNQGKEQQETYAATAVMTGGAPGSMMSFTITIDSWTSDTEMMKLVDVLKTKGPDALADAIDKTRRGRIAPTGRVGNDINIARSIPREKGRIIRLVSNRPLGFLELRHSGRSVDYQFTIIELHLNEKGEGDGVALGAAKVKFNEKGQLEIEHYGQTAIRLANVHRF